MAGGSPARLALSARRLAGFARRGLRWSQRVGLWVCGGAFFAAPALGTPLTLERTVVRFSAPEAGGVRSPLFILERTLAFETRLEALAEGDREPAAYRERHVRAAMERHISETLLASLPIDPEPSERELAQQTELAREILGQSLGGPQALEAAARDEGISAHALRGILRRRARASLYLDRMVAPMLRPSDAELRALHGSGRSPYRGVSFEEAAPLLIRWYIGRRMSDALSHFFQGARSRLTISVLAPRAER